MSKLPSIAKIFDPSKLDAMNEPLFVRVEKTKGGTRSPLPLPGGEDGSPGGSNWSKDDVRGIEGWLVNEFAGGGSYTITVSDSSLPTPQKHDWSIYYDVSAYPEKIPSTLAVAAGAARPSPQQQQVRPMGSFPSAFPNGLPGGASVAPAQAGQPTTVYVPQPYYQQQQPPQQQYREPYQPASATAAIEAERRRYEEQMREMQGQLARQREEMLQAQFRQELDRKLAEAKQEQAATNERFSRIEQLMERMMTATTKPAVDPALEQLKEQNRMLAAQAENERREREAERREREMRDLIQRQQEDTRRQIEAMNAQVALAATNKTDPMIMFLQENARQQIEAVKEQARNQTTQMTQLQTYMMNPRDIMAMAKESSNGLDQATRSITTTYQSILEMQRNAVEQILQLNQGGGNETLQLIEKGLDRASSFAERFIGGKTKEAVSAQTTQAQLAQANAAAMQAQAQAMTVQAAMQRQHAQQAQAQQPDSGLNGARPAPEAVKAPGTVITPPTDSWSTGPIPPPGTVQMVRRVMGHTDEEWFGPILPKVIELREGVVKFIESISMKPPRLNKDGTVEGVEPEQAATVILQAAMIVMQQQIPIAAMIDLLGQGRVAEFMDVLLPEAPQPYRDEVAQMVLSELQGGGDDDEDEDEDEDGDDEEIDKTVPKLDPNPSTKPAPRARA